MGARDAVIVIRVWIVVAVVSVAATLPPRSARARGALAAAARDSIAGRPSLTDSVIVLPEVRVDRERLAPSPRAIAPTTFVTQLTTRESGRALVSLGETLAQAAGVRVLQYGGLGAFSTVSVRGAPASQTALLVDGEPLESAAHSLVSLSDVPAAAIERIEVYRGLSPLAFGMPAPAGAVNLVTLPASRALDARVARGSFGTWEGWVRGGATRGEFAVSVNAGYQGSRGDFKFFDDNGTPYNRADDSTTTRINNRFDATHAIGSVTWSPRPALRVRAREDWFRDAQGVPGLGAIQARTARHTLERSVSRLEIDRDADHAWPELHAHGSMRRERARFRDLAGELGLGRWQTDDRFAGERAGLELGWPRLWPGVSVRGSADAADDRARPTNAADAYADPPASRRDARGAALAMELSAPRDRATLYAARRWDRVRDRLLGLGTAGLLRRVQVTRETNVPQLGARVSVMRGLDLRANWTDAVRVPDFSELFGDVGNVYGNLLLRPEHTRTWDAGTALLRALGPGNLRAEWAHFRTDARDLIEFLPAGPGVKPANLDHARIQGDELEVTAGPFLGFTGSAAYTRQSAIDASPYGPWRGKRIPALPATQLEARLEWARHTLGGYAELSYLGPNDLDRYNTMHVSGRALGGAGVTWALGEVVRVTFEGRNLGDVRATDVAGFPLPGRTLSVAFESRFRAHP